MASIGIIAQAVTEIAKVVGNWQVSKDRNRLLYRIEAGTQYIFIDEGSGEYSEIDEKKKKKLKLHFRRRVFDAS